MSCPRQKNYCKRNPKAGPRGREGLRGPPGDDGENGAPGPICLRLSGSEIGDCAAFKGGAL